MVPDKTRFLSKFSCFDGYIQSLDHRSNQLITSHGLDRKEFNNSIKIAVQKKITESAIGHMYDENFITPNCLVQSAHCGGYTEQPICLYDFTVKSTSNDCLNFSTRHMLSGKADYIREDYIDTILRNNEN